MSVFNLGSINLDHVYRLGHFVQPGETTFCRSVASFAGGKGYNQSVALARAGVPVRHIGAIGEDGRALLDALAGDGVDIATVAILPDVPTGHAMIQVNDEGQNCIIVASGANTTLTGVFVREALASAEPGDILLAQNETTAIAEAIQAAHAKGLRVALNPAPMNAAVLTLPLERLDFLIVNEIEGSELLRLRGRVETVTPDAVLGGLHACFPDAVVVMTLGRDGVMAVDSGGRVVTLPAFRVEAVDTTAAGDTFTGYFLAGILRGDALAEALWLASAASAISVTRSGASPSVPRLEEVEAWLARQ